MLGRAGRAVQVALDELARSRLDPRWRLAPTDIHDVGATALEPATLGQVGRIGMGAAQHHPGLQPLLVRVDAGHPLRHHHRMAGTYGSCLSMVNYVWPQTIVGTPSRGSPPSTTRTRPGPLHYLVSQRTVRSRTDIKHPPIRAAGRS